VIQLKKRREDARKTGLANYSLPFITLTHSPLVPGPVPVKIYYRESGHGVPLVFLHGGWGYEIYPFNRQIQALGDRFSILIPDRSGYGRSTKLEELPSDFHARAAVETMRFLEALDLRRPVLWGHSDGAVIAAHIGLAAPERIRALVLEAFHFYRVKPGSREFFQTMASDPERMGRRVCETLASEHGERYWQQLMRNGGQAWLNIACESVQPNQDLYGGRLSELRVPALFIHGGDDPRTEPGELAAVREALPSATVHVLQGAGHSPHSECSAAAECNARAREFFENLGIWRRT
jgi:pimeloyl-ACP methyl ester carboxylesterase